MDKACGLVGRFATSEPSFRDARKKATGFQSHSSENDYGLDLSQHRFKAEGFLLPSREGNIRLRISSPPSKPVRRKSNESGESIGACEDDVECFSFHDSELAELLPIQNNPAAYFLKDENVSIPSKPHHLTRCSTVPARLDRSPCEDKNPSFSPQRKKKTVKATDVPLGVVFVSMHENMSVNDDDTLTSQITHDDEEEDHSKIAPLIIKTKSYSMSSEKISAKSPSKPIRKRFADEVPARNASFDCQGGHPGIVITMAGSTVTNAANNSTFVSLGNRKSSYHSSPLNSPPERPFRSLSVEGQVRQSSPTKLGADPNIKGVDSKKTKEVESPFIEKPRLQHKNMFLRSLTWNENDVKQSSRRRRKRNIKSSRIQELQAERQVLRNDSSAQRVVAQTNCSDRETSYFVGLKTKARNRTLFQESCSSISMNSSVESSVSFDSNGNIPLQRTCRWHSSPSVGVENVIKRVCSSEHMPGKPRRSSSRRQKIPFATRLDKPALSTSQDSCSCRPMKPVRSVDTGLVDILSGPHRLEKVDCHVPDKESAACSKCEASKHTWGITKDITLDSLKNIQRSRLADSLRKGCYPIDACISLGYCKSRGPRKRMSSDDKLSVYEILSTVEAEFREQELLDL